MFSKLTIAPIVGVLFAAAAFFHVGLPDTMTQPAVVAAVLLASAAITAVMRAMHGDPLADAKNWYQSKVLWTQVVAAIFAILALFGIVPAFGQQGAVEAALAAAGVLSWIFGAKTTQPLA